MPPPDQNIRPDPKPETSEKDSLDPKSFLLPKNGAVPPAAAPAQPAAQPAPTAPQPAAPGAPSPGAMSGLNPKDLLLPQEGGPSLDSAERQSAAKLFAQEAEARREPFGTNIGAVTEPYAPPAPKPEESVVRAIETYGADINRAVRQGVSVAEIAAAEAERRTRASTGEPVAPQELAPVEPPSAMRPVLLIAGALLILCGLGIAGALLYRPAPVAVQKTGGQAPFVQVDDAAVLAIPDSATPASFMTQLNAARARVNLSVGLVEWLYVGVATTTAAPPSQMPVSQFLTLLAPDVPPDLLRSLSGPYLLGVHSFDENQTFLILRVDSYQGAFAAMLAWEPTMRRDLLPLFNRTPPVRALDQTASSTASSTPAQPEFLNTGFVDRVVDNHDARAVVNDAGDLLLLWTFLDRNTLVVTTNEYTLSEVIRRLNTASLVPLPH